MISQHVDATSRKTRLSAAQPKPKDRGEINAFVPDSELLTPEAVTSSAVEFS